LSLECQTVPCLMTDFGLSNAQLCLVQWQTLDLRMANCALFSDRLRTSECQTALSSVRDRGLRNGKLLLLQTFCHCWSTCWSTAGWCQRKLRRTTCGGCCTPPCWPGKGATTSPPSVALSSSWRTSRRLTRARQHRWRLVFRSFFSPLLVWRLPPPHPPKPPSCFYPAVLLKSMSDYSSRFQLTTIAVWTVWSLFHQYGDCIHRQFSNVHIYLWWELRATCRKGWKSWKFISGSSIRTGKRLGEETVKFESRPIWGRIAKEVAKVLEIPNLIHLVG